MTVQCCKCKKVRVDDEWVRPGGAPDANTSHTYCPVCFEMTISELRAEAADLASDRPCLVASRC